MTEQPADAELITIEKRLVQCMFDLAVGSLNFGSGWWDTEDVEAAREVAVTLGVDPQKEVPDLHFDKYGHVREYDRNSDNLCGVCAAARKGES